MKKILYILGSVALLTSCNLDTEFYSEAKKNDYIKDDNAVNNLVMGCYNALHLAKDSEWAVTELRTDNTRASSSSSTSDATKAIEVLDQSKIPTTSVYVSSYWNDTYTAIYRSNEVLVNLNKVSDEASRAQYKGEAKFLRALHYFNLVRLWGGVFKVTEPISAVEARNMQRVSKADIYELIESDLTDIIDGELLPLTYPSAQLGRATMTAAKALLAKVYMTNYEPGDNKYAQAEVLLNEVMAAVGNPTSATQLEPFANIFDIDHEMSKEIIFTVRYKAGNLGLGSPFGNYFAPVNNGGAVVRGNSNGWDYPAEGIIAAFTQSGAGDIRKEISMKEGYYNLQGAWVGTGICRYVNKFMSPVLTNYDGESDWPVIRVGDVALLLAEIENELNGPTAKAFQYLNMVRGRAGVGTLTVAELPSKYDFREAVRRERRLELCFENQWLFDLMRWGIAAQTINADLLGNGFYASYTYPVTAINEWQVMLPIPQSVININPDVAQNMGY